MRNGIKNQEKESNSKFLNIEKVDNVDSFVLLKMTCTRLKAHSFLNFISNLDL